MVKDDRKTIYVRNVPYSATEDDVVSFFSACGVVVDFHRGMTDGASSQSEAISWLFGEGKNKVR